jgi:hypothetical protein
MKDVKKSNVRVLFENDEVGFEHAMVTFNDGNKEAVMSYYKFKDGKLHTKKLELLNYQNK